MRILEENLAKSTVVRHEPRQKQQTKNVLKRGKEFDKGISLAKNIRSKLGPMYYNGHDSSMTYRLVKEVTGSLKTSYDYSTKNYHFSLNSFSRLEGFNFNIASPLENTLLVTPEINLCDNIMTANLPQLNIPGDLKFPIGCQIASLQAWGIAIALRDGYIRMLKEKKQEIIPMSGKIDPIQWAFKIPPGCLGIIGFTICYYKNSGDFLTLMNSTKFWPAAICSAIYNPGIFQEHIKGWQNMGINFE